MLQLCKNRKKCKENPEKISKFLGLFLDWRNFQLGTLCEKKKSKIVFHYFEIRYLLFKYAWFHIPFFPRPLVCPEAVCEACADADTDVKAILAIDCHADLEDCHAGVPEAIAACHEPLKDCVKCHIDPTDDACTKACLIGPGPCLRENKIEVAKCVAGQSEAVGKCAAEKQASLAKAEECLACAVACKKDE